MALNAGAQKIGFAVYPQDANASLRRRAETCVQACYEGSWHVDPVYRHPPTKADRRVRTAHRNDTPAHLVPPTSWARNERREAWYAFLG